MKQDIRTHYPITAKSQIIAQESTYEDKLSSRSSCTSSSSTILSFESSDSQPRYPVTRKRTAQESQLPELGPECTAKCSRLLKPVMGAGIRSHPSYQRVLAENNSRLEPVCQVPLPAMFQHLKSLPVSLSPVKCTAETQTSPLRSQPITPKSATKRMRNSRRNSGASMISNIRKSFGTLRRAMSAERLNSEETNDPGTAPPTPKSVQKLFHSAPQRSPAKMLSSTKKALFSPIKMRFTRTNPTCSRSRSANIVPQPVVPIVDATVPSLSWTILERHRDGSFKIRLDRANLQIMFGVNVARDEQGLYVSRLGSVRTVAAYWDLIHAGDRILQVNNVDVSNLSVQELREKIQDKLSVEFHVKPAHPRQLAVLRSGSQSCLYSSQH
ncbi:hypothetical protein Ciccas_013261 [Cichlidogyrus casuarinus]|uniref:PDZ domain-containing protein n=1 Tax=Cichlidogyrus casuarinus TaxID=1844966 RepID=A0ABD2PL21_9PLAT